MPITEIYKDVEGYEGSYQVSNHGNVKNVKRNRILKAGRMSSGYMNVVLCKHGKTTNYSVHRLVAKAFLPNPEGHPEVNHLDECKANNISSNLEWVTRQGNAEYTLSKVWVFVDPYGEVRTIYNLNTFCKENNLDRKIMGIIHGNKGTNKTHKGWVKFFN